MKIFVELAQRTNLMSPQEVADALGVDVKRLPDLPHYRIRSTRRWEPKVVLEYAIKHNRLMELEQVAAIATPVFSNSCIYFLLHEGTVVYVGQSKKFLPRLGQHTEDKEFDSVAYIPCPEGSLLALEWRYIMKFQPKYNKTGNYSYILDRLDEPEGGG